MKPVSSIRNLSPSAHGGFTMIELVMVIVLIAIVAVVAAPMLFRSTSTVGAGAMARKVKDDVRYAQSLAMVRSNLDTPAQSSPTFRYRVRFNVADANCAGAAQYTIVNDEDNNGAWGESPNAGGVVESGRDPATGSTYFCVQLTGDYSGFTVTANFGGSVPGILEFDTRGIPYDSDGVKLAAAKNITIAKDGESLTLTVTPNTGLVTLP
jgi:prepilin-type N-terminal cleavage/methylation domain-containing protein